MSCVRWRQENIRYLQTSRFVAPRAATVRSRVIDRDVGEAESSGDEAVHESSVYTHGTTAPAGSKRVNRLLAIEYSELQKLGY